MSDNFLRTRIADVMLDRNGIIIITMKDAGEVDEEDLLDLNLVVKHLSGHKPSLKLFDARAKWDVSPKAKKEGLKMDRMNKTLARAIVVSSSIKASLFSFMRKFQKKEYPQEFFTDFDTAYKWLLKHQMENDL